MVRIAAWIITTRSQDLNLLPRTIFFNFFPYYNIMACLDFPCDGHRDCLQYNGEGGSPHCGGCETQEEANARAGGDAAQRRCKEPGGAAANLPTVGRQIGRAADVPPPGWDGVSIRAERRGWVFVRGEYTRNRQTIRYEGPLAANTPLPIRPISPPAAGWREQANIMLGQISELAQYAVRPMLDRWARRGGDSTESLATFLNGRFELGPDRARVRPRARTLVQLTSIPSQGAPGADWLDQLIYALRASNMEIYEIHLHFHAKWRARGPVLTIYLRAFPGDPRIGRPPRRGRGGGGRRGGGRRTRRYKKRRRIRRKRRRGNKTRRRKKRKTKRRTRCRKR
jgi:hypothetical protein